MSKCSALVLLSLLAAAPAALCQEMAMTDGHIVQLLDETIDGEYSLLCPVGMEPGGETRIAFDVTSPEDMGYVRLAEGKAALFSVTGGNARRVGKPRKLPTTGALEVTVQRRGGRVRVIAGGQLLLDEPWAAAIEGRVGVGGEASADDLLVQPVAPAVFGDDFTREEEQMAPWETAGGTFRNSVVAAEGADPLKSANPFSLRVAAEEDAVATTGDWFWDSYDVSASVRPHDAESVGLCAYVQDAENYLALRWTEGDADAAGACRLVHVTGGEDNVLTKRTGGFKAGEWYRLELHVTPGRVEALIDRDVVLSAETGAYGQGGIGLWAAGGEASFDDALVTPPGAPRVGTPYINPVFIEDSIMAQQELYLPRGFWEAGTEPGTYWHCGRFFDDATVTIPLGALRDSAQSVLLQSPGTGSEAGYRVTASSAGGHVLVKLERNGERVLSETEAIVGEEPLLIAAREGSVDVSQGGHPILSYADLEPLTGRHVALIGAPAGAIDQVTVTSEHFQDTTFSSGPTDWYAGKGVWDVTSRWHCSPGWTFLGGTASQNPILWTKHAYSGDIVVECFAGIRMEESLVGTPTPYIHPSDINLTICGDGQSLESGYSFLLAGWNNTKSAIVKNGEVVAEAPDFVFNNPSTRDSFHRHWFRLRAEKLGNTISFSVDGVPVAEYTDPEPLEGGRVGLWTFHNDLMVARARLWYAEEESPGGVVQMPPAEVSALQPTARDPEATEILNDFEADCGEWSIPENAPGTLLELDGSTAAAGKRSLRLTTHEDGGPFTADIIRTPFRVAEMPILSFDYRLDPEARLNFYIHTNGAWHALEFTAEDTASDGLPIAGGIPDVVADGKWRHAEVSLLELMKGLYPQFGVFQVDQLVLAPPWESYVRCGIGGNGLGTSCWIDNFRIGPVLD